MYEWLKPQRCRHGQGHYRHGRHSDILGDRHAWLRDGPSDRTDVSSHPYGLGFSDQLMGQNQNVMEIDIWNPSKKKL
jgi:hypothetical protein